MREYLLMIYAFLVLVSCAEKQEQVVTPWGTTLDGGTDSLSVDEGFSLSDIQNNGELIMLTLSGPQTYYDYHGKALGLQYLLCERFAQSLGVSLRVEVCKDTAEMVRRLSDGEADIVAFPLPVVKDSALTFCGASADSLKTQWAVSSDSKELAQSLNSWFKPEYVEQVRQEESFLLSARSIKRHVYSPMLNRKGGVISHYDKYFQQYAPVARMDWRLMAAQCYQESCFDPKAKSWAGACGLMQIMPGTAAHLGLPLANIYEPEANIAASAKYMAELAGHFGDVKDSGQRILFVLAAYNGGFFHVRDAMALARKYGKNDHSWADVSEFILKLKQPEFYNDPVVKHGYMRGDETFNYVDKIRERWADYRGMAKGGKSFGNMTPAKATKNHRFKL